MGSNNLTSYLLILIIDVVIRLVFREDLIAMSALSVFVISVSFFFVKGTPLVQRLLLSITPVLAYVLTVPFLQGNEIKGLMLVSFGESFLLGMVVLQILEVFKKDN